MEKIECYSPLRVSFSGGGTDISPFLETHGTKVINTTIDRGVRVIYTDDNHPLEISSRDFLKTVILGESHGRSFQEKTLDLFQKYGIKTGKIYITGEVPPGSGLGSSSAIVTGLMKLIYELRKEKIDPLNLAKESYSEEKNLFGITLGIQDPYAISIGGFKYMESDGNRTKFKLIENRSFLSRFDGGMIICYTGGTRESSDVLRAQVQESAKEDSDTTKNLMELLNLSSQNLEYAQNDDYDGFCRNINTGWEIKRRLGPNVSSSIVESIINTAKMSGASAARLLGGGSQGFVLVLGSKEKLWNIQRSLMNLSDFVIRVSPTYEGTRVLNGH